MAGVRLTFFLSIFRIETLSYLQYLYEVFKNCTFVLSNTLLTPLIYTSATVVTLRMSESAVLPLPNTVDAFLEELAVRFTLGKPQGTFTGIGIKMCWAIGSAS